MSLLLTLGCAAVILAKPKVMVLGMYHFANPGLDAVKVKQKDILSAGRQQEVETLVESLAKYKPTRILVEVLPEGQEKLDRDYAAFKTGEFKLPPSETYQLGFRLAKQFRLSGLEAVDYRSDMDFDGVMQFAAQNGQAQLPTKAMNAVQKLSAIMSDWDQKYTVSQILAIHNKPDFIKLGQTFYTQFLAVQKAPAYPGADMVAGWYRRNLVIYQNIRQQLQSGDRALVIYGSGHAYYLNQLIADSGDQDLVEARKFLPLCPITKLPDFGM